MTKTCPNAIDGQYHIVRDHGCVTCANADEMSRFNERVSALRKAGTPLTINDPASLANGHIVIGINLSWDLRTHAPSLDSFFSSSWALCNDGRWAKLLRDAGVSRNPMHAEYTAK